MKRVKDILRNHKLYRNLSRDLICSLLSKDLALATINRSQIVF